MSSVNPVKKKGFLNRFLDGVERAGNKLPHPFSMFLILCVIIMVVSLLCSMAGVSVVHPSTGDTVAVKNLLSRTGVAYIMKNLVKNFIGFAPLGVILTMSLGIGLSEECGLIFTFLRKIMLGVKPSKITFIVIFSGIMANIASDAAFIIIPPLAGIIFLSVGRNPLAGIAAGYAGVAAGFTANLLVAGTDALLAGITNEAIKIITDDYHVAEVCNWYFLIASTFILSFVGSFVSEKIVEPRLGSYTGNEKVELVQVTELESKGLRNAGLALLGVIVVVCIGIVPPNGILRGENGAVLKSPFMQGLVPIIFFMFVAMSLAYGKTVGTIKSEKDVPKMMGKSIQGLSGYIVMAFAAAQFIAFFNWTNLGTVIAINGANFLKNIGFTGIPLVIGFIIIASFVNLFIGSGSAKWALLAPIFVPMLMLLEYDPGFIQLAYRIGDSVTNPISPLFPHFPVILAFMQQYKQDAGVGTVMSSMLPYSMIFLIVWIIQIVIWMVLGLPVGPGTGVFM